MKTLSLFISFLLLILPMLIAAQETKMSLTMQPIPSVTSNGETIFPTKSESHQFSAGEGGTFDFVSPGGGSVKVVFFIGTTQVALDFFIDSYEQSAITATRPLPVNSQVVGGLVYNMKTFEGVSETVTFDNPFAMTVGYLDSQVGNLNEETLNIYFWNEDQNGWETFASSSLNTVDNTITVFTDHLTLFATLGEVGTSSPGSDPSTGSAGSPQAGSGSSSSRGPTPQPPTQEFPPVAGPVAKVTPSTSTQEIGQLAIHGGGSPRPHPEPAEVNEKIPPKLLDIDFELAGDGRTEKRSVVFKAIGAGMAVTGAIAAVAYFMIRKKYAHRV